MHKPQQRRRAPTRARPIKGLRPLRAGRKSDAVFEQISESIRAGRFPVGMKLPPERDLAAMFNTSRPTVREAIHRAELVGFVEVRHGSGSFVLGEGPRSSVDQPLLDLLKHQAHRVGEFFEIRRLIEGWCAAQAARNAEASDVAALKARLDAMRVLDVGDEEWELNDIAFHRALAAATGNPLALRIMEVLRDGFSAFYRFKRFIPNREEQRLIWQHHADIYEAVAARAPDAARKAIIAHMDFIEQRLGEGMHDLDRGLSLKRR
ncbi:MAG TPA: FCD domain-containing protein [Pseudolabrys sp.]|nr:FCD domain-containing protein [Pseudolabrys sp.]